jgi:hypothetical protein
MQAGLKLVVQALSQSRGRGGSIIAPLVVLAALCLGAAAYGSSQPSWRVFSPWLVGFGLAFACLAAGMVVVLVFRAPEKLQSEDHELRLKALELLKEQSRARNLKPACLENAFDKLFSPYRQRGPGG